MLGAMVTSTLADIYGRKKVVISSVLAISAVGFANAWVQHYWMFVIMRFLIGFFHQVRINPQTAEFVWNKNAFKS